jgi:hypothetical protein
MTLTIPRLAPSLNRALRMHWSARKREQAAWDALVLQALSGSRPKMERARVEITRFYAKHALDKDGAYGAQKPVIDALVHAGIIPDDSPEHIELTVLQVKVATVKEERTEIRLEAMEARKAA